jgi:hypothetical protein
VKVKFILGLVTAILIFAFSIGRAFAMTVTVTNDPDTNIIMYRAVAVVLNDGRFAACPTFMNVGSKAATTVTFLIIAKNVAGRTLARIPVARDGMFSPEILIEGPDQSGAVTRQSQYKNCLRGSLPEGTVYTDIATITVLVQSVTYADGSHLDGPIAAKIPDVNAATGTIKFIATHIRTAPINIIEGRVRVEDSAAGNSDFYVTTCYLARNETSKAIEYERYKLIYYSVFNELLDTTYTTLNHHVDPHSEDDAVADTSLGHWSECLQRINQWGNGIGRVEMSLEAVKYGDGTTWFAKGHSGGKAKSGEHI